MNYVEALVSNDSYRKMLSLHYKHITTIRRHDLFLALPSNHEHLIISGAVANSLHWTKEQRAVALEISTAEVCRSAFGRMLSRRLKYVEIIVHTFQHVGKYGREDIIISEHDKQKVSPWPS